MQPANKIPHPGHHSIARNAELLLSLVRTSPDILFLSVFYQLISEIRMGYGYDHLGAFPGAPADEVHCTVFRHEVIELTSRRSDYIPLKNRLDIGFERAVLFPEYGRHADERFAAF